ncbi:MAG: hypothetical protein K0Q76_4124, partial [Panacagrimonas sp.]|nr:hypothetical protein [Panacagrimonas sp.]
NWERPVHGGPKNQTFFDTAMEFIPECLLVESTLRDVRCETLIT